MKPSSLVLRAAALLVAGAAASAQLDYRLAFEPGAKSWNVEVRLKSRGEEALDFWIELWTPGAYHVAEYGKRVNEFTATGPDGKVLTVERPEPSHFVVRGAPTLPKGGELVLRYRADSLSTSVFSNGALDVESNRIAKDYAYLNPGSVLGFVPARAAEAITLGVALPAGWRAASALERDPEGRFHAPSFARLEDSPLLFSPTLETVEFTAAGKAHSLSVQGRDADDTQAIAEGCQRIVESAAELMGGLPYERYHFLIGFVDEGLGSGLEHSYSTLILVPHRMEIEGTHLWGLVGHEFFHLWCAERIHVQGIHQPDFTQAFETGTIWVNEGITEYFTRHVLLHAGYLDESAFLAGLVPSEPSGLPPSTRSWTDVSRGAASWNGMMDIQVFAERMYSQGPRTILALDLEMRRVSHGERGVLDLVRYLMSEYHAKDRGFGEDELPDILQEVAGGSLDDFYGRFIDGPELPDLAQFLGVIGYRVEGGAALEVAGADEAALRARKDFFSVSGQP